MKKLISIFAILSILLCSCGEGNNSPKEQKKNDGSVSSDSVADQPNERYLTISAVGDCTLSADAHDYSDENFDKTYAREGDEYFFKNCKKYFEDDDLTLINLECAVSSGGSIVEKEFNFRAKPEYMGILTSSSVEAATIANNHSLDYGQEALDDTKDILDENDIKWCIGDDVAFYETNGVKVGLVGIYALTDEGSSKLENAMRKVKDGNPDIIVASFHWGIEKDTEPMDEQVSLAHKAVDLGANLVIGHHPHVLQGIEKYNGAFICYSMGNFCFGGNNNPSDKDSIIFRQTFTIGKDGTIADDDAVEIIPMNISSDEDYNNFQPTPASPERRERIVNKMTKYSKDLGLELTEDWFGN